MINYDEVFSLLVAACPSFEHSTDSAQAEEDEGEFLRVGHLAFHLIELLLSDETDSFAAVFGIVDWVLAEGSAESRMLVADGFLHDLTSLDRYGDSGKLPSEFVPWLGPCARRELVIQPFL
ncbi:MAG: hypothetical protein QOI95_2549 [Acidimicrobiaceae bacterium]